MTDEKITIPAVGEIIYSDFKPDYKISFHKDNKLIGLLDFNGPQMVFSGDLDESARVFFDFIANSFAGRLEQERLAERDKCVRRVMRTSLNLRIRQEVAEAIRGRGKS